MDINAYLEGFKAGYELAERERAEWAALHKNVGPAWVGLHKVWEEDAKSALSGENEISECKEQFIQSVGNAVSRYWASVRAITN